MKTIKQMDAFHPDRQIKQFFNQIHLGQMLFTFSVIGWTLLRIVFSHLNSNDEAIQSDSNIFQNYGIISFLTIISFSDFWLFMFASLSDFKRQQQNKGTLTLVISILFRSHVIILMHYLISDFLVLNYPIINEYFFATSIPLQCLLMVSISQSIYQPNQITYFFVKPFQIKTLFKPFFYVILIEIFALRLDILVPIMVEILFYILKINARIIQLSKLIEQKYPNILKLQKLGYQIAQRNESQFKQLDILKTNNSIILEEK